MEVKIKRLTDSAVLPTKAHATDAGYDLYADSVKFDDNGNTVYGTGIAVEIPNGYVGLVFPRSSVCRTEMMLKNCVGVIDSGYRGEITAKFEPTHKIINPLRAWWDVFVKNNECADLDVCSIHTDEYLLGERIAQLIIMPYPEITFKEVTELSDSDRGTGGYGSSGK